MSYNNRHLLLLSDVVDEAVVDLAVDAGVGVVGANRPERRMQRRVLRDVEEIGGRLKERVEVVRVGHLDVDDRLGLRCSDAPLVRAFSSRPDVETVRRPALPVQDVQVVGPGPDHEENKVSDAFSFGFEKVVLKSLLLNFFILRH